MPLPDDVRELLQAIHGALDIPSPAFNPDDPHDRAHRRLLERRASYTLSTIDAVLHHGQASPGVTELLREWIDGSPVTYTPWQDPQQDGGARP